MKTLPDGIGVVVTGTVSDNSAEIFVPRFIENGCHGVATITITAPREEDPYYLLDLHEEEISHLIEALTWSLEYRVKEKAVKELKNE